jgi:hypothetical protein
MVIVSVPVKSLARVSFKVDELIKDVPDTFPAGLEETVGTLPVLKEVFREAGTRI